MFFPINNRSHLFISTKNLKYYARSSAWVGAVLIAAFSVQEVIPSRTTLVANHWIALLTPSFCCMECVLWPCYFTLHKPTHTHTYTFTHTGTHTCMHTHIRYWTKRRSTRPFLIKFFSDLTLLGPRII